MGIDIIKPNHLDGIEDKIAVFLYELTGIKVQEKNTPDKVMLVFGDPNLDRLELGFYPARHPEKKDFRYSMYIALFGEVIKMMQNPDEFEIWCYHHKMYDHD